jgi:hypothetical protein
VLKNIFLQAPGANCKILNPVSAFTATRDIKQTSIQHYFHKHIYMELNKYYAAKAIQVILCVYRQYTCMPKFTHTFLDDNVIYYDVVKSFCFFLFFVMNNILFKIPIY